MKKRFLGIFSLIALLTGFSFAENTQYPFCQTPTNWLMSCGEKQICNNPNGVCRCKVFASPANEATEHLIDHNTTCLANTQHMQNMKVSSFAVSGSTITFELEIQNTNSEKIFELQLPNNNPRIRITNVKIDKWSCNGALVALQQGLFNPRCNIDTNAKAKIKITGELSNDSHLFDVINTNFYLKEYNQTIESKNIKIFPTSNFGVSQKVLNPTPNFEDEEANYIVTITNNSSKATTTSTIINVETELDKNLVKVSPIIEEREKTKADNKVISSNISAPNVGESKTITINTKLKQTPLANTNITTISRIKSWTEIFGEDNIATTTFTTKRILDLEVESVEKTSDEPEKSWDEIWFLIKYKNKWNETLKDIKIDAEIDWINMPIKQSLEDLEMGKSDSIYITWVIDKNHEPWTKFCISGELTASNETEGTDNNKISRLCYSYVKSADLAIKAELKNPTNTINSGSILEYQITISNLWEKTATGIVLKLFPSNNQKQYESGKLPISINWGENYETTYKTILMSYPARWTKITLSGEITLVGIDWNLDNNKFLLEKELPALADVFVKIDSKSFTGFKIGDQIIYTISYGNIGYGSALNPEISLELPDFVRTEKIERNLWKSMPAGQTWEIQIIGSLTENLSVNTSFDTTARIKTDSAQTSTENDISTITTTVVEYNNISFDMAVRNASWPIWDISTNHIRAASWHDIIFTINYRNDWNVAANNVSISMPNHWPLTVLPFDSVSTIWIWQAGTIEIPWEIIAGNFDSINPTAALLYNNQRETFSVTIEEPYECGDGLITKDEPCDTALDIDYWRWLRCVNQWWVCVLTTEFISNTACVEAGGVEVCDTHDLYLKEAICENIVVSKPYSDQSQINVVCNYNYAFIGTPYRIICGNDNILTGFVGLDSFGNINNSLQRICSYPNAEIANASVIRCQIWSEITNNHTQANCERRVPSCEVEPETKVVILDNGRWEVLVQCSTNNNQEASLRINCGNGTRSSSEIGRITEYICRYTEWDLPLNKNWDLFNISCEIDWKVACENDVIVDMWILWVCGDGIKQWYEQCDLGRNGEIITRYLDTTNRILAPASAIGKRCNNCAIEDHSAAQCLSVFNENISIEKWEYLPFWWKLDTNSFSSSKDCSYNSDKGKIIKNSLRCEFELQRPDGSTEIIYDKECSFANPYPWNNYPIFSYFKSYMSENTRVRAVDTDEFSNFINAFGEYKLRLRSVTYDYCDDDWKVNNSQTDNICETNMTITQPYMVQKSAFGVTPKAANINLDNFRDINGDHIIGRTDLRDIMILDDNDYKSFDVSFMVKSFIEQTEKLAVKVSQTPRWLSQIATAKKIPNKDIYILEGQWKNIEVKKNAQVSKPFTIIVKNANLIIKDNMDVNWMFIVKDGTIKFETDNCNSKQVVKWIFIADKFDSKKHKNDDLNKERCNQWGLQIKWVLIGWWITDLTKNTRSTLSKRFNVSWSENSIKVQRRNEIFRWAAVEIEYSPELWQQLPPGADEFTQMLDIYKK